MAQPNITPTASRNLFACTQRAAAYVWFGTPLEVNEIPPIAPNNESIRSVNNAGTAYVDILKVNASDQTEFTNTTGAVFDGPISPAAGVASYGGQYPWFWALGYVPAATTTGTNTTGIANQQWVGAVWVPVNMTLTGVAYLIGTLGGTDKAIVSLYTNSGTRVAFSTTAGGGTTVGTGGTIQSIDFTATYNAKGPALYFLSVQTNGTTAKLQTVPIGVGFVAAVTTNTVAIPAATITPPSSFTANTGPVAVLY